ncbi:GRF1-interacting factor 2-like isoform X2 [Rhododendron vialii]|uniref:GRF1-interacting factor 2-like isoform X2 n=1 Tax=Rhododendron vialii TaxID=182163 RepID=UPI00265DD0CD|nr:GRF1-interacting factor 2-like isoform X2 [Rhododendron vialii]
MQQPPQMLPSFPPLTTDQIQKQPQQMLPSFPPLTTDQIQKYLEENKKLILAILENQNLGKLAECAQYQAQLQKNLMYLAAIADAQPQAPTMPAQMAPHPAMQAGGFYMPHPQAAAMGQQSGLFPQRPPLQFNSPHQLQEHLQQQQQHQHQQQQQQLHQHHQQAMQGQMGMRSGGANNGMHPPHAEAAHGGVSGGVPPPSDARGGSKQDASEARTPGTRGPGSSGAGHGGGGDGDLSHTKGTDEAK